MKLEYNAARNGTLSTNAQPEMARADFDDIEQMPMEALRPFRKKYIAQLFSSFLVIIALTGLIYYIVNTVGLAVRLHLFLGIPDLDLESIFSRKYFQRADRSVSESIISKD